MPAELPLPVERAFRLARVDFAPAHRQPSVPRLLAAMVLSLGGSLFADALLVRFGEQFFPSTWYYPHFLFSDYAKLTVIGVIIACLAWPVVTRVSSAPRWLFFRQAIAVTLVLLLPDAYLFYKGQNPQAVGVLVTMHLVIALITYNCLVHLAKVRPAPASYRHGDGYDAEWDAGYDYDAGQQAGDRRHYDTDDRYDDVYDAGRDPDDSFYDRYYRERDATEPLHEVGRMNPSHSVHPSRAPDSDRRFFAEPLGVKVPQITALFWVVKILTTAGGEAASGFLALGNWTVGGIVEVAFLVIGLTWQFRTRRYVTVAYWFLAYAIATCGTGIADGLHVLVGIPYEGTSVLWALVLAAVLWLWYRTEGTLSIHSITTRRRECFYWTTVFATFALGTALGDFTATVLHLGYLSAGIAFAVIILIPLVLWSGPKVNSVFCFWFAYVLTRPLGASFADYFSKPHKISGADFGYGPTAAVAVILTAILVGYLAISHGGTQRREELVPGGGPDAGRPRDHRRVSY